MSADSGVSSTGQEDSDGDVDALEKALLALEQRIKLSEAPDA